MTKPEERLLKLVNLAAAVTIKEDEKLFKELAKR